MNPKIRSAGLVLAVLAFSAAGEAEPRDGLDMPPWAEMAYRQASGIHENADSSSPSGIFPAIIPRILYNPDATGIIETYNAASPTFTASNPFFQSLGANGRSCATCHEPRSAWSVSADSIRERFRASRGTDPIFRLVDGATCPTDDTGSREAKLKAYRLLLSKGLIRVFLPLPANQANTSPSLPRDYEIAVIDDPYACTDLTASQPMVSVYRRPLPSANLRFLTECPPSSQTCPPLAIMADGREPSLESQVRDATLIHAQALTAPSAEQIAEIVDFETQIYDAQVSDNLAGDLNAHGAAGGAFSLSEQNFYIGINDVLGADPLKAGVFSPDVFSLYGAWNNLSIRHEPIKNHRRDAIARGEVLFNTKQFTISDVNGLNLFPFDPLGAKPLTTGTCTICHDSPNVGNHSKKLALNIGVSDADPPVLDVSGLPVFSIACTDATGPLKNRVFKVTDPAKALISGNCADAGKVKGPILHGLAARAPYFHNGSAATLKDVVEFYNQRFGVGFTEQEKEDLAAFLHAL